MQEQEEKAPKDFRFQEQRRVITQPSQGSAGTEPCTAGKGLEDSLQRGWMRSALAEGRLLQSPGANREFEPSLEGWKRRAPRSRCTQTQDSAEVGLRCWTCLT